MWLYPDGRVDLRGIAPVREPPAPVVDAPSIPLALKVVPSSRGRSSKAQPNPAQTKATASVQFSVSGVAEKRAYAKRKP